MSENQVLPVGHFISLAKIVWIDPLICAFHFFIFGIHTQELMAFIENPVYVLAVLALLVLLSVYSAKTSLGKNLGAALLVILYAAVLANLNLIPSPGA